MISNPANSHVAVCSKCKEKAASMECSECESKGLRLCYNCDITTHEFSFKNSHLRTLIRNNTLNTAIMPCLTPRMQTMKASDSLKGSATPRVHMQENAKPKFTENKENRARNSSVGVTKKQIETKVISLITNKKEITVANIKEDIGSRISKYQELINKKDQVIESLRLTIDNLTSQLSQAQSNVKQSHTKMNELKGLYNEDLAKMKFRVKKLEDKRGHSINTRTSNVSADLKEATFDNRSKYNDKEEECGMQKEQMSLVVMAYKKKYEILEKEKERQLENLNSVKWILGKEESDHRKTKERLKLSQKEIGDLRVALSKK